MAKLTGMAPDGVSFLVSHEGVTVPATMGDLAPYPDLQQQAIDLSSQSMTQQLVAAPQAASPSADAKMAQALTQPDDSSLSIVPSIVGLGKRLIGTGDRAPVGDPLGRNPPPPPQMVAAQPMPPVDVTQTPPPAPGTEGMAPAAPPVPPPAAGGGGAPTGGAATVPRGTVRAAPVITEPATSGQPAAPVQPNAQAGDAQAEDSDLATIRQQEAEKGKINQRGINAEQEAALNESAWQDQNRQAMQEEGKRYATLRDQALAAHNLDPSKFWHDKGALGSILFAISAGAQGAAGGWNGHPEAGANYVDNAIKQNLELQEKRAASLDKAADAQGNLVQLGRQMGLDHRSAYLAAIPLQREMVAKNLEQTAYKLGPGGNSAAFIQAAQGLREKNAAVAKTQSETYKGTQEGNLAGANVALTPLKAREIAGSTAASYGSAASSNATARKTNVETENLGITTNADRIAKILAAEGHVIPPTVELGMSQENRKNLVGPEGGKYLVNNPEAASKILSDYGQYDATLAGAHKVASNPKAGPEELTQAANQAKVAAKVANELKRGGEGDKDLLNLNPGFGEFMSNKIDWAQPGRRERFLQLLNGERVNQARRTTGAVQPYGHPGVQAPAQTLVQPGVAR